MDTAQNEQALLPRLLRAALQSRASDLHLRANSPPFFRVDGTLNKANSPPLTPAEVEEIVQQTSGRSTKALDTSEWEYSFDGPSGSRFRGHVFLQDGAWALTMRVIPSVIPTFQDLRLPVVCKTFCESSGGLVLITGPTGSGKTTTAAAMMQFIAAQGAMHILTIEDPIEYKIADGNACVSQREVGRDTKTYADGLRAAMREDPDVLFIGEIRDRVSLEVAMQAAETGHLVLSTFHTGSTQQTIQRMLALYPLDEQAAGRERIADALKGIICQRLLPRKKTRGRVLATEVAINNYAVKECIRDPSKLKAIQNVLERSGDKQMHTLDQQLGILAKENMVEVDVALAHAAAPADLRRTLNLSGVAG